MLVYYAEKTKDYTKASEVVEKMVHLYPVGTEENKFATSVQEMVKKAMAKPSKNNAPNTKPTSKEKTKGNTAKLGIKKKINL